MEALLRRPGARNDVRGGTALARPEGGADERMMAIVPRRFDEHPTQMGVARFGDAALRAFRRRSSAPTAPGRRRPCARRRGKATGSPSSAAMVNAVRSSMPRKQRSRCDAGCSGASVEQGAQVLFDSRESGDGFIDRAQIGPMRLIEGRERPRLRPQPGVVALGPGLLGRGEAAAVAEQEFGEPMARAEQIGADVLATPQQSRGRLLPARSECGWRSARRRGRAPRAGRHRDGPS